MQIGLRDIPKQGLWLREELEPSKLALEDEGDFVGLVRLALDLDRFGEKVRVEGLVRAVMAVDCHRCTEPYEQVVEARVQTIYQPRPPGQPAQHVELDEETLGLSYYDEELVDLAPLVRDIILLELPIALICSPDCVGLCASCGGRKDACDCAAQRAIASSPFAALAAKRRETG